MTILAGDWADDDGTVLDSQLEPHPELPQREQLPTTTLYQVPAPKQVTRTVTGSLIITPAWGAVQILPEDPNRVHLELYINTTGGAAVILLADNPGDLECMTDVTTGNYAPRAVRSANTSQWTGARKHTGALWVNAQLCTTATVAWCATTSEAV